MKSTGKEALINFLLDSESKDYTWLELAHKFEIKPNGTDSQRRKAANDIWRNYKKQAHQAPSMEQFYHTTQEFMEIPSFNLTTAANVSNGKYAIMGCVHVPFFHLDFMKAALKCLASIKIDGIILNGDFLDLNTLSFHDKGKNAISGMTLGKEYASGNEVLNAIDLILPKDAYKVFLYGNHEDRFNRHMGTVDYAKLKGALKSPEEGLNLRSRGYEVYTDWINDEVTLGDLTIIHGEFVGTNSCKRHLDAYRKNILYAHTHRVSMYREGEHVSYNIGSMADFDSPAFGYATKSMKKQWTNGFVIATVVNGKTTVEQIIWNKDHFVYGGNIWKV